MFPLLLMGLFIEITLPLARPWLHRSDGRMWVSVQLGSKSLIPSNRASCWMQICHFSFLITHIAYPDSVINNNDDVTFIHSFARSLASARKQPSIRLAPGLFVQSSRQFVHPACAIVCDRARSCV